MFWIYVILAVALIIGVSVVAGRALNNRAGRRGGMTRQQQITAAKVSGAFPIRKENQ